VRTSFHSVVLATVALFAFARPASADGKINVGQLVLQGSTVGAEIFIDGERIGVTPLAGPLTLTAEEHTIKIVKPGYAPMIDVIRVQKKKQTKLEVELTPVAGILRVRANVPEARVFIDGKFVGEAPLETDMPVGARAIQVSHAAYKDFFRNVEAVAGQEVALEVTLEELPPELNPYIVKAPPPPKWYQKWWVWTVGLAGVGAVATAVTVPIVESQKNAVADFHASYNFTVMSAHVGKSFTLGISGISSALAPSAQRRR
jgi:hypothetical protein